MTLDEFRASLRGAAPDPALPPPLQGLWWDARGDWDRAHVAVQDAPDRDSAAVHAYLHRKEGDLGNAGYWYRRAGAATATDSLAAEWDRLAASFLVGLTA